MKAKSSGRYEELKRYLMAFTMFCFCVAIVGMTASGSRVFTIAWGGALVIVLLQVAARIIIWMYSSWEQVMRGAAERRPKARK